MGAIQAIVNHKQELLRLPEELSNGHIEISEDVHRLDVVRGLDDFMIPQEDDLEFLEQTVIVLERQRDIKRQHDARIKELKQDQKAGEAAATSSQVEEDAAQ
ncbi:hypothetical protein BDW74DRAFT_180089 [Aspergillus multicolor]|uniref:uncharacterized protein n=1 Tax=Aspergillus multicolor TaxID=41759 RepID=UPI003CCD09F3